MKKNQYHYESMIITDYRFRLPLDYKNENGEQISIFAREILNENHKNKSLPYLIFLQGGPGYESPRPLTNSGWIKRASEDYKVLLLDQRGTGLSNPISSESISDISDLDLAYYLTLFRSDNIIKDAERIRKQLIGDKQWSVLGQSFGGFCATHYLSFYPESLEKVYITGGLPPLNAHPDDIYRSTFNRVIEKNVQFHKLFPNAQVNIKKIADYLSQNETYLPNGDPLSVERFQQLGLNLGFSDGMATLNFLFERAFINNKLSYFFLKNILSLQTFDTNPIFTILHEACYAQNFSTNWSAQRILSEYPQFSNDNKNKIFLTGEMLFPWMLDSYQSLQPFKGAAYLIAKKKDWPKLYDESSLRNNKVPIVAAVYTNDMYVDREYSMDLAEVIPNISVWESDLYEHNALRSHGEEILDILFHLKP